LSRISKRDLELVGEMTARGFLAPSSDVQAALDALSKVQREIEEIDQEIARLRAELADGPSIADLIREARARRIERVREERSRRRALRESEQCARREAFATRKRLAPLFLGEGVSAGLRFDGGDPERVAELGLPALPDAGALAVAIGLPAESGRGMPTFSEGADQLAWLCYHRRVVDHDHYSRFRIPKRSGGYRNLASPKPLLRKAQRWIFDHLTSRLEPHARIATAWRKGRSVVDNARPHVGKAIVIRVDIKDFFPSISWRRVRRVFMDLGYSEGIGTILALLTTDVDRAAAMIDGERRFVAIGKRGLPQGACTSPSLANFVALRLDKRVDGLCRSLGFAYTRYADDLTFSHEQQRANVGVLLQQVYAILRDEGFEPNERKTSVMRSGGRQMVTGLMVQDTIRISRRDVRRFRAIAHQCKLHGIDAVSERLQKDARAYLDGFLAWVRMANEEQAQKLEAWIASLELKQKPNSGSGTNGDASA
jgi:retron-type reverse transcriptase